ncbi:RimJ/RimL family protein N-acetyltransferase [Ulvibacter sp. MAR_2010_11]|uniref:GNAT family N-acetyltransferase n=1 Tax=Ulvibacter sp. MAR_2010_11 TaxID=1250229 RepID=UPI000C2B7181|nr:GNAT family N-acetyltransferase [Ulvibacter sp. MAR_2010_11]PKA83808.1 RimJ/RimL family protein N-acetyltransferase [Ulvibacter sp. MAR_2010_11]
MKNYIIETERLGLRNWLPSDEKPFIEMCKDQAVMQHFPKPLSNVETITLIQRLQNHFHEHGYCYFAVDELETAEFIGFAGIMNQTWESEFTPCVDIGWRLKKTAWGKGYATEAAKACLEAAFNQFQIKEVLAFTTDTNTASENVMKKIGMEYIGTVQHPMMVGDPRFKHCVVYKSEAT